MLKLISSKRIQRLQEDSLKLHFLEASITKALYALQIVGKNRSLGEEIENNLDFSLFNKLTQVNTQLFEAFEKENERLWSVTGIEKLSYVINKYSNSDAFYDKILAETIKYVGANQGSMFLVVQDQDYEGSSDEVYLEKVSTYAYDRKRFHSKRIVAGEGLVGQCYLEKQYIYMTNIPKDYLQITSGLGYSLPENLIIVPFTISNEVVGILELASFSIFNNTSIDFLLKIGEFVATVIYNKRNAIKTEKLLLIANEQKIQLEGQKEELFQIIEELKVTQEEVYRKEKEIIKMKDQDNILLESKLQTQKQIYETIIKQLKSKLELNKH